MILKTVRPYQTEAIDRMLELREQATFGVGLESPTGTGKSIMMAMLAARLASQGRSVLILAHRKELVEGNAFAVEQVTGERCYKELNTKYRTTEGDWNDLQRNGGITSACIPTMQGRRLRKMPTGLYTDIICDEAHHVRPLTKKQLGLPCEDCDSQGKVFDEEKGKEVECEACEGKGKIIETGSSYMKCKAHFNVPVWYGLSGTLYRKHGKTDDNIMTKVFDKVYSTGTLFEFIDQGWLVDMRIQHLAAVAVHLDFSRLAKKGMVTDKQAQEVWQTHKLEALSALRHGLAEWCKDRTTLIFSPKVQHAKWVTEFIQQADTNIYPNMGPETADYVASYAIGEADERLKYDDNRRTSIIERLRAGSLQWCANQGVFTEGTDIPTVGALALCRVTQSINLIKQMIGRGARTLKGVLDGLENATPGERKAAIAASKKPDCLVLDFVGAMTQGAGQYLANPTKIVEGEGWGEAQKKMAAEYWKVMWEKGKAPSLLEAKEEIEHATSDWMKGVRAMLAESREEVTWEVTEIDPRGSNRQVATTHMDGPGGGATDKQVRFLVSLQNTLDWQKYSYPEIKAMTARQVGKEIDEFVKLRNELPMPKWMYKEFKKYGIHHGFPNSWGKGQEALDKLKKNSQQNENKSMF